MQIYDNDIVNFIDKGDQRCLWSVTVSFMHVKILSCNIKADDNEKIKEGLELFFKSAGLNFNSVLFEHEIYFKRKL